MNSNDDFRPRTDKHYLGGGDQVLFTPPYPSYLGRPGFWDVLTFDYYQVKQSFVIDLFKATAADRPLSLKESTYRWLPYRIEIEYKVEELALIIHELKFITSDNRAVSHLIVQSRSETPLELIFRQWGQIDFQEEPLQAKIEADGIVVKKMVGGRGSNRKTLQLVFANTLEHPNRAIVRSRNGAGKPDWQLSPFYDWFDTERKEWASIEDDEDGFSGSLFHQTGARLTIPAKGKTEAFFSIDFSANVARTRSVSAKTDVLHPLNAEKEIEQQWGDFFSAVPRFRCSDPHLEHYACYRWYCLKLLLNPGGLGLHKYPAVAEGIGFFHTPISYSTQAIVRDLRWHRDKTLAKGLLKNFFENQREDGSFPGRIYQETLNNSDFYHADWGGAVLSIFEVDGDKLFIADSLAPLLRYLAYFETKRDRENSCLFDIFNHFETGQEFSPRYTSVDPSADLDHWQDNLRMKGVDVSTYIYQLVQAIHRIAELLGERSTAAIHFEKMQRIRNAMIERMWDKSQQSFFDLDTSGAKTMVMTSTNFYPYMTDLVSKDHIQGLLTNLCNPKTFWSNFPVATLSMEDPHFSAEGLWKGKRRYCPWNGRVWPMTNSHIIEALVHAGENHRPELLDRAGELLLRFIKMMCYDGDPTRPNCYEHYNPINGKPALYRGIDDYLHSWINDLLIKYVVGFRPSPDGGYTIKSILPRIDYFSLVNLRHFDLDLSIEKKDRQIKIHHAGKLHHRFSEHDSYRYYP